MKRIISRFQSEWDKYLIEMLVIAAGIMLAFGLNSWNDIRKRTFKEQKVLADIEVNIQANIDELNRTIKLLEDVKSSCEIVLEVWEQKTPYADSLNWHFFRSTWTGVIRIERLSTAGYENLKNLGFDLIKNDSAKVAIIESFELYIPIIRRLFQPGPGSTYWLRIFYNETNGQYIPIDYDRLLEDKFYYSLIRDQRVQAINKIINLRTYIEVMKSQLNVIRTGK